MYVETSGGRLKLLRLDSKTPKGSVDPGGLAPGQRVKVAYKKIFNHLMAISPLLSGPEVK
ncbi:MAG: hypothetical protein A2508_07305 [Candidatus Lambdaproteobacteria bacterium RIFOXYD12_FULL_49_8]|uniref:Uncharacterized protein n=1 Tax=Candidatus Lambdaproteobacteria bacterium RIFOXYD2_FULL_50_16 TaxID=1817772 RepID=A0A1F6GG11_9PROT|nr:MAG: hypothetical protein A2527_03045 [Candidatus Lambdaproteobacteria bacterium RIFOXYD2_FULL_50_16]OGG98222.1 MAG: hypothetical protein A2508_07305 [Candidatus Lambdaproteobacteria bacterium RIFOXYD12_FULL_49_8]